MNLRSPDDIEVRGRKLREILARHEKWLASEFREGQRAYLSAADLRQVDLSDQDLRLAQLAGANLTGADLSRTKLKGAVLNHAILRDAILNSADLGDEPGSKAEGGQGDLPAAAESKTETSRADWGGADLTLARLPAGLDPAVRLNRCAAAGRRVWQGGFCLSLLLAAAALFLITTRDHELLLRRSLAELPFVARTITVNSFFWIGPAAIFAAYLLFHYAALSPLWNCCRSLPAVFPDAATLAARREIWPFGLFAERRMPLLRAGIESRAAALTEWSLRIVLWWAAPAVLACFWWRYLSCHEWSGTLFAGTAAALALGWATTLEKTALRRLQPDIPGQPRLGRSSARLAGAATFLLSSGALLGLSWGALEGGLAETLPVAAQIRFQDLSQRPPGWNGVSLEQVQGAQLAGANLRYAEISYCFLVRANLAGARLENARLIGSDLRGADLTGADLRGASLFSSGLADARLQGADLRGASLLCARNLAAGQLAAARTDSETVLPSGISGPFVPGREMLRVSRAQCDPWDPSDERGGQGQDAGRPVPAVPPEIDLGPIPELGEPAAEPEQAPSGASPP